MDLSPPGTSARPGGQRTLTESLRVAGAPALDQLLRLRPDLADPPPRDLADLSARSTTVASLSAALDALDTWQLAVAEAVAALPDPTDLPSVAGLLGRPPELVTAALQDLRARALLWGDDHRLHLVRGVREAFGPYPGGLAPPSPQPLSDPELAAALADCEPADLAVIDRLVRAPAGRVPDADRSTDLHTARSPVERLLARRLLRPVSSTSVLLPREVALARRGGHLALPSAEPDAPGWPEGTRPVRLVDNAAAGAALSLVHDLELVVHAVERGLFRRLRDGGLAARDVAAVAAELGVDGHHAGFLLEAAAAGDLIAFDGPRLTLTTAADPWAEASPYERWRTVGTAWLASPRLWTRSTEPGAHVLGPEADLPRVTGVRGVLADALAAAGPGRRVDGPRLAGLLAWQRPRLQRLGPVTLEAAVTALAREAAALGVLALDCVSSLTTALRAKPGAAPADVIALFPDTVDRIVLQSDLTAVAGGPLPYALAAELRLLADQESRGGGGVFRFSEQSVRRGLDAGWSAGEISSWLTAHSSTGVPQPLRYLVEDVARRHGGIRVGPAGSYLRIADEAQLAALLRAPEATVLGLRRIGPDTVVAAADPEEVVDALRLLGHSPVAEDARGEALSAPRPRRLPRSAPRAAGEEPGELARRLLAADPRAERRGPGATEPPPRPEPQQSTAQTLLQLTAASRETRPVRVRFLSADGAATDRTLSPVDLGSGRLRAVDVETDTVIDIPLARITFALPVESAALD